MCRRDRSGHRGRLVARRAAVPDHRGRDHPLDRARACRSAAHGARRSGGNLARLQLRVARLHATERGRRARLSPTAGAVLAAAGGSWVRSGRRRSPPGRDAAKRGDHPTGHGARVGRRPVRRATAAGRNRGLVRGGRRPGTPARPGRTRGALRGSRVRELPDRHCASIDVAERPRRVRAARQRRVLRPRRPRHRPFARCPGRGPRLRHEVHGALRPAACGPGRPCRPVRRAREGAARARGGRGVRLVLVPAQPVPARRLRRRPRGAGRPDPGAFAARDRDDGAPARPAAARPLRLAGAGRRRVHRRGPGALRRLARRAEPGPQWPSAALRRRDRRRSAVRDEGPRRGARRVSPIRVVSRRQGRRRVRDPDGVRRLDARSRHELLVRPARGAGLAGSTHPRRARAAPRTRRPAGSRACGRPAALDRGTLVWPSSGTRIVGAS